VYDQLNWQEPEVVGLGELEWVFEYLSADPLMGEGERSWQEKHVGAVRIGERLYPISGLDLLAAARSSSSPAIECLVITTEKIIDAFTGQGRNNIYIH